MKRKMFKILVAAIIIIHLGSLYLYAVLQSSSEMRSTLADQQTKLNDELTSNSAFIPTKSDFKDNQPSTEFTASKHSEYSRCPQLPVPDLRKFLYKWKTVIKDSVYVYSAFPDGDIIRLVGIARREGPHRLLTCQLWYRQGSEVVYVLTEPARVNFIPEDFGRVYAAVYFKCKVRCREPPYAVSIVANHDCELSNHVLPVFTKDTPVNRETLSICVPPFNFRYSRVYELVEWIELNLILGIQHFTFYNYSSEDNIKSVLAMYASCGLVDVLTWDLPMHVDQWPPSEKPVEIHYFGQLAAINDCLHRNRNSYKYTAFTDLDEFVVPHNENVTKLTDLLRILPKAVAYSFRSSYFRKDWSDTEDDFIGKGIAEQYQLVSMLKLDRDANIFRHGIRSKFIVKADSVQTVGVHKVWRMAGKLYRTKPDVALLHHYRNLELPDDDVPRATDSTMLKYKDTLLKNVAAAWKSLKKKKRNDKQNYR